MLTSPTLSDLEVVASALDKNLVGEQSQVFTASLFDNWSDEVPFAGPLLFVDPARSTVVLEIANIGPAFRIQQGLSRIFPSNQFVQVVTQPSRSNAPLIRQSTLDSFIENVDEWPVSLWIAPLPRLEASRSANTLHWIVSYLRSQDGCPWDRKQTYASLRDKLLEEAHETIEAIDQRDTKGIRDELGDLLLLIALYSQMAEEAGDFTIEDVYAGVNEKLVRRHPHVFGDAVADTPEEVLQTWKSVKATERGGSSQQSMAQHRYEQLPQTLSPIQRIRIAEAVKLALTDQIDEELLVGDQLLFLVQQCHRMGIDPERAIDLAYRRTIETNESPMNGKIEENDDETHRH